MNDCDIGNRKISSQKVKNILTEHGVLLTDNQAILVTDFIYSIAEIVFGKDFINTDELINSMKTRNNNK